MSTPTNSPKYDALLSTAKRLFWKHGIRRVSIEEICREAGVSKMTFYRYFPNKIELAKAMLEGIFEESMRNYRALMDQDIPFEEKVRQQLHQKFEGTREISAELIRDIYSNQDWGLLEFMQRHTQASITTILNDYAQAQEKGWIRQGLNLKFLLFILRQMQAWVTDEELLASYDDTTDLIMEIANFFFYGILPPSKTQDE
jgi:AcrR family transcriptional regulator